MDEIRQILVFSLDGKRYALYLDAVERAVRAVEVVPLPDLPEHVLGIINIQGRIVPVISLRRRFRLPETGVRASDQFIIAFTPNRTVALVADAVEGVVECPTEAIVAAGEIMPHMDYVEGVVKLADGMVLISDLGTLLSLKEEDVLRGKVSEGAGAPETPGA